MQSKKERNGGELDYLIAILMIAIVVLGTFLMPQLFGSLMDRQDLNQVRALERETFVFENPVEVTVYERVQQMMDKLGTLSELRRTLSLGSGEVVDGELVAGIRDALGIAVQYKLLPDITGYDIASNILYAEYYNLSNTTEENTELAFWNIRFSDYQTFDFSFRVDASNYIIYQAELYCAEVSEYMLQVTSDDREVVAFYNEQFMTGSEAYFEAEGYGALTDVSQGDMVFLMGYERGEYALYHSPCNDGNVSMQGVRWGFVPMTLALEGGTASSSWGVRGIEGYYSDLYGIDISGEDSEN